MKTLSIYSAALIISILALGSFKPLMPSHGTASRGPALEKTYKPLKQVVKAYLVANSR